ncbi:MAG TPA: serine--tRNA ligase [candidate division Zixibacteria bacterium]|nr:serine--tRNA ligase [candidate division Zixibacteria bacterium]
MLDLKFIRENAEKVRAGLAAKGDRRGIDEILRLDERRRELIKEADALKAKRNSVSMDVARLKKEGKDASGIIAEMKTVSDQIAAFDKERREVEEKIEEQLLWIPNLPHASVPVAPDESGNVEIRSWGKKQDYTFTPAPHWEVGERLELLDLAAATKISGAGFITFTGWGAKLVRALINFMLDLHTQKHGYREISPPFLVNRASMFGTGQLPKLEEDMYGLKEDDLFLIPTAEVPLTNLFREEILSPERLPLYVTAYTPCFRREAGAAGKDTRGITRVHQFDKVELVKIVRPENSYDELETLVQNAEAILQALGLHYRLKLLASGDMSFASAKTYDLEVWAPGVGKYLEVSSCSNFEDFQARRMNLRFRSAPEAKPDYPHTLNGSGLALPRTVIAILEQYQTERGTVRVPEVLVPYLGSKELV